MDRTVITLGVFGKHVVGGLFQQARPHWQVISEPFELPPTPAGKRREQIEQHPALQPKLREGADIMEISIGDGPAVYGPAIRVPISSGDALLSFACATGLPSLRGQQQQVVAVDLSAASITAAAFLVDPDGQVNALTTHRWTADDLPLEWSVERNIMIRLLPADQQLSASLRAEIQRQVDAYLWERETYPETPPLELFLPSLVRLGAVRFVVDDAYFSDAVAAVLPRIRDLLVPHLDTRRVTFLCLSGSRCLWPGVEALTFPGRVRRQVVPTPDEVALATGAALWPAQPQLSGAKAYGLSVEARAEDKAVSLLELGAPETQEREAAKLVVKFCQPHKEARLQGRVVLSAVDAAGQSYHHEVALTLPPNGPGFNVLQRIRGQEAPLEQRDVPLHLQVTPSPTHQHLLLSLCLVDNAQSAAQVMWSYHEGRLTVQSTAALEIEL